MLDSVVVLEERQVEENGIVELGRMLAVEAGRLVVVVGRSVEQKTAGFV